MSLHLGVMRSHLSLQPLRNPSKPPAWDNSDGNNSLDLFALFDGETPLFSCRAQTVANLEGLDAGVKLGDTIAPGPFQLRFRVERRHFYCQPNGLCFCRTLAGQLIGPDSEGDATESLGVAGMEGQTHIPRNDARWLNHDWEFQDNSGHPFGEDTRVAWSAGCFVVPDLDLRKFNAALILAGVKPGDLIPGVLEMEA